jgi:ABC-type proline/glycine betaine transport system substrate-binding protein
MKKIIGFLSIACIVTLMACSNNTPEVKKEVVVAPPVIVVKDPPAKSTTVVLDKNGVKVETKKVNVNVKK